VEEEIHQALVLQEAQVQGLQVQQVMQLGKVHLGKGMQEVKATLQQEVEVGALEL
jgi:hypothetical protein